MIVTRTPFRVTLGGGGTDLPSFYREHGGFVFAMGIDKYMYIMLNPPTVDNKIRLHYSRSEIADDIDELQHELAREAFRLHGIRNKIEVSSMADLPDGTGLGSSSAYLVGLLTALHQYRREFVSLQALAEEACHIELDVLGKPIGKQDQYMAAYGGLTVLDISPDGQVQVRAIGSASGSLSAFVANTHLYYTGHRRSAVEVLREQDSALLAAAATAAQQHGNGDGAQPHGNGDARQPHGSRGVAQPHGNGTRVGSASTSGSAPAAAGGVTDALLRIKDLGYRILDAVEREEYDEWGHLLHEHWCSKKQLSNKISLDRVDLLYEHVRREHGVLGGKIAGAGGGGFLMLYCPRDHRRLESFMLSQGMPRLHYAVEHEGTKVVANMMSAPGLRVLEPAPQAVVQAEV